jgi:hypothetical protein
MVVLLPSLLAVALLSPKVPNLFFFLLLLNNLFLWLLSLFLSIQAIQIF